MSLGLMIDKKTKRFVRPTPAPTPRTYPESLSFSALSLRLFGKDITTVGQQKDKNEIENQDKGYRAETPVEHAPMVDEDRKTTPAIDYKYVPGETEDSDI